MSRHVEEDRLISLSIATNTVAEFMSGAGTAIKSILCAIVLLLATHAFATEPDSMGSRVLPLTQMMPQLSREKQIWIYLPPGYGNDERKRFPVLYVQDGQYLFEALSSSTDNPYINESLVRKLLHGLRWYGSWQVDKRLDRLFAESKIDRIIVVGISSGDGNRTAEYSPWPWQDAPVPEGAYYAEFVVRTLKPYIDSHYLTLSGRSDTGIAGSSMGGLLALYAGLKYQNVFSKVAALSPVLAANVVGRHLFEHISRQGKTHAMKIYIDLGSAEPSFGPLEPVHESLQAVGFRDEELWFRDIPEGEHRIEDWGARFPQALRWLYPSQDVIH